MAVLSRLSESDAMVVSAHLNAVILLFPNVISLFTVAEEAAAL